MYEVSVIVAWRPILHFTRISFLALFLLVNCSPKSASYGVLAALEQMLLGLGVGNGGGGGIFPPYTGSHSFLPGDSVNLNGNSGSVGNGTILDPSNNGSALGIATEGNGVPNLIFLYQGTNTTPYAVDVNGDGLADYYLCYPSDGTTTLHTGTNCGGNQVFVRPGQGFDTNGDGVVDNPMMALLASDFTVPHSSISPSPGIYGGAQNVTITCADNLAPGNIAYTLDGTTPSLSPANGHITNPPSTSFAVGGSGDGDYTVQYRCRDLAGRTEGVNTATYQINHAVPNVTISTPFSSAYVSANSGAVNLASFSWKSNQTGSYSVRQGGTGCTDGNVIDSGLASANAANTSFVQASQLAVGLNTLYICVTAGLTGRTTITITRDDTPPTVSTNPGAGAYGTSPVSVQLVYSDDSGSASGFTVLYTLDNSNPTINSATGAVGNGIVYNPSTPISLSQTTTIRFLARDPAGNVTSSVQSSVFTIDESLATITLNSYSPASRAVNASSNQSIAWQFAGNGASYKVLIGGNKCSSSTNGGTTTYQAPSGTSYSNLSDCECTSGTALAGGASAFKSGNVVSSGATGSDIQANTAVTTVIDNLNFVVGKNSVLFCVANQTNQPHYASVVTSIWKDTLAPQVTSTTPTGGYTGVDPTLGSVTVVFSEPMDSSFTPTMVFEFFDGSTWQSLNITNIKYVWDSNNPDTFKAVLPWVYFPENALIRWKILQNTMRDVTGILLASDVVLSFMTTTYSNAYGYGFTVFKTNGNDATTGLGVAHNYGSGPVALSSSYPGDLVTGDAVTGLKWKSTEESGTFTYNTAVNQCSSLNLQHGGVGYAALTNWRLPTVQELETLSIYQASGSANPPAVTSGAFTNFSSAEYWSSTLFVANPTNAWFVNFNDPDSYFNLSSSLYHVRCVSGVPNSH
ncbi:DUF1566 domain-containing protein [Leptospira langatensis]|uniref:DUF1566 domain-containing protein n=2 Tax=Leptospira langatensis TaxID=2484983 RepID=A0A5F1ZPL4_9LEPT|nr:DUF1566 domain-containing protein [Leptospira langatensis]TGL38775.1 DUF1566 domain-containing protein [Leptospira langatensis]